MLPIILMILLSIIWVKEYIRDNEPDPDIVLLVLILLSFLCRSIALEESRIVIYPIIYVLDDISKYWG